MASKPKVTERRLFNAFTKSYKLRYVVHAAERDTKGEVLTVCGRHPVKVSTKRFDEAADGSCQKCKQKLEIARRIHPGWDD